MDRLPEPERLRDEEQRIREQYRLSWERVRMAEAYRIRPRSGVEGRPASLGLVALFGGFAGVATWVVVSEAAGALGPDGPGANNVFAEPVAGAAVVGAWLLWLLVTLGVLSKYLQLRRARALHEQELARAIAVLRSEPGD